MILLVFLIIWYFRWNTSLGLARLLWSCWRSSSSSYFISFFNVNRSGGNDSWGKSHQLFFLLSCSRIPTPSWLGLNVIDVVFRKLICDSRSSDSFAERSTVDYIVPGEMELMSAVRSVSCNSSMSKCNKTEGEDEEYGPISEGPPLIDSLFVKQPAGDCPPPPPPPPGTNLSCSNPDLVQVKTSEGERGSLRYWQDTKLWDRAGHKVTLASGTYAPHQYFPPRLLYPHHHNATPAPRLQFLPVARGGAPHHAYLGPPQYRHPPPVQIHSGHGDIEVTIGQLSSKIIGHWTFPLSLNVWSKQ